jgi:hypothetical protein
MEKFTIFKLFQLYNLEKLSEFFLDEKDTKFDDKYDTKKKINLLEKKSLKNIESNDEENKIQRYIYE